MRLATFLLVVGVHFVAAQSDTGSFLNPPLGTNENDFDCDPVWTVGETQMIEWITVFSNFSITLWQQGLVGEAAAAGPTLLITASGASNVTQLSWDVQVYNFNLTYSPVFFFWLAPGPPADGQMGMTSRYFNISSADPSSTASTPTSTTNSTVRSTIFPPPPTASSNTSLVPPYITSGSTKSSGLSKAAQIGVALASTVFAVIVFCTALFCGILRRQKAKKRLLFRKYGRDAIQ